MTNGDRWLAAHGGTIYTLGEDRPLAEALLARNGVLAHVGTDDDVRRLAAGLPRCETLDLRGRCVLPGFTDSHIHLLGLGFSLERVALAGVASLDVVLDRVGRAARATRPGEWVQGWGWDHSLWPGQRFPNKTLLDHVAPEVPVALRRKDGHMVWVNSAALAAAGIDASTPEPPCGRIGRMGSGEPDGLLFEEAAELVWRVISPPADEQVDLALRHAAAEVQRLGVTGAHVPEGAGTFGALQRLDAARRLTIRVTMMLAYESLDAALSTGLRSGFGSDRLRVGPVKLFADGSLGSETAAMLEPFAGSQNDGLLLIDPAELRAAIQKAASGGLACAVHAIGDRANRVVLDAFEATRPAWQPAGLRQRIEHVQVLHPEDLPRLAALGISASMQPIHATQDMELVDRLWGARGRYAYAFRSLLDSGAALAFGSDAPVETPDPLAGVHAAVTRQRADGSPDGGWYSQERLSVREAVQAYTLGAARAAGLAPERATLAAGNQADFVVLSEDIVRAPEAVRDARVVHTVFDGQAVYSAE
jgi:predicted amidohydrolase YtcJ